MNIPKLSTRRSQAASTMSMSTILW